MKSKRNYLLIKINVKKRYEISKFLNLSRDIFDDETPIIERWVLLIDKEKAGKMIANLYNKGIKGREAISKVSDDCNCNISYSTMMRISKDYRTKEITLKKLEFVLIE